MSFFIISKTQKSTRDKSLMLIGARAEASKSQLSFQSKILLPFPILHLHHALRINLELQILLHTKLELYLRLELRKSHFRKYLALYNLAIKIMGLVKMRQPYLPNIAKA
jgi:hypothetical protein